MKTIKILLTLLLVTFSMSASAQDGGTTLRGDVNEDGVVDVLDVTTLIDIILGNDAAPAPTPKVYLGGISEEVLYGETLKSFDELYDLHVVDAAEGVILGNIEAGQKPSWGGDAIVVFIPNEKLAQPLRAMSSGNGVNWSALMGDMPSPIAGYEMYYAETRSGYIKLQKK